MQIVYATQTIMDDTIINDYLQKLGDNLVSHTNAKNKKFHFFVIQEPSVNAFAGPDGYIGVHTGTFTTTRSESELASVLAHEIAHVTQHHIEYLIEQAKNAQIAAAVGTLAALVIGTTAKGSSADLATGTAMASLGGVKQHIINFTKEKEIEADNIG